VIGAHSHLLLVDGWLGETYVAYGLGNFLFKENSAEGARTGVLTVQVPGRRVDSYEWIPGRIQNSVPRPLDGDDAASELAHWRSLRSCTGLTE
jgi:poly-gamma-glutamate synthesis protein (capsule biosynthesis protein)